MTAFSFRANNAVRSLEPGQGRRHLALLKRLSWGLGRPQRFVLWLAKPVGQARTSAVPGHGEQGAGRLVSSVNRRRMKLLLGIALFAYAAFSPALCHVRVV